MSSNNGQRKEGRKKKEEEGGEKEWEKQRTRIQRGVDAQALDETGSPARSSTKVDRFPTKKGYLLCCKTALYRFLTALPNDLSLSFS